MPKKKASGLKKLVVLVEVELEDNQLAELEALASKEYRTLENQIRYMLEQELSLEREIG